MLKKPLYLCLAFLSLACGSSGSENAIRTVISGQQIESRVQNSRCFAELAVGNGGTNFSPVRCQMSFRTQGVFTDELSFVVSDVVGIYQNYIGQWIQIDNSILSASLRLQGQEVAIFDGMFAFDRISNVQGGPVCGQYQMRVGAGTDGYVSGSFCTSVGGQGF